MNLLITWLGIAVIGPESAATSVRTLGIVTANRSSSAWQNEAGFGCA